MALGKIKLYLFILFACAAGYIWVYINTLHSFIDEKATEVCLIKKVSNIPCPSCGSTRSLISLLNGNFSQAVYFNPFGYFFAVGMFILPIWIIFDLVTFKSSFFIIYNKAIVFLRKPIYAIPLSLIIIFNWIWNILKGV
jgi:hypothetical protein